MPDRSLPRSLPVRRLIGVRTFIGFRKIERRDYAMPISLMRVHLPAPVAEMDALKHAAIAR